MKLTDGNDVLLVMKKKILIVSIVVAILGLFYLCFWFGTRIKKPTPVVENKIDKAINIVPKSGKKGFPFITKDLSQTTEPNSQTYKKLFIWTLNENKMIDTGIIAYASGGFLGYGDNEPVASPNRLYTAYVDIPNERLNIISHETLEKVVVSKPGVEYISGWSTDSNRIVYYVNNRNIETVKTKIEGMEGADWTENEEFSKEAPGFYLFDLETGKTTYLYPLTTFDSFVDSRRILSNLENNYEGFELHNKLVIFNTETFEADYSTFKEEGDSKNGQFSFYNRGGLTKWAYTGKMGLVLADYPNTKGEIITTNGSSPQFSPDGAKIAFSTGNNAESIDLYDIQTKSISRLTEGRYSHWMDDKNILIEVMGQNNTVKYNVMNIETKELKPIPSIE